MSIIYNNVYILTPPRCGSTYMHEKLCINDCGIYIIGPQSNNAGEIDKHTVHVPYYARHMPVACMIRHPYLRSKSLHRHFCVYQHLIEYDEFAKLALQKRLHAFYSWTLCDWLGMLIPNFNVDINNIEHDIRLIKIDLTAENNKKNIPFNDDLPKDVETWAECDLQRFNF